MGDAPRVQTIVGPPDARSLPAALDAAHEHRSAAPDGWLRVVQRIEAVPLFAWLRAQAGQPRLFWGDRAQGTRTAAAGLALHRDGARFEVLDDLPQDDGDAPDGGLRTFVTCRFDLEGPRDDAWRAFAPVAAWIPAVSIHERDGEQHMSVVFGPGAAPFSARPIEEADSAPAEDPHIQETDGERDAWRTGIEHVLHEIGQQRLQKGVFTRRVVHHANAPVDPIPILERLDAQEDPAYRFLVQPTADTAFVGLSPERLYRRRNDSIESEALAGTTRRGSAPEADAVLGEALLQSRKDRHEHDLVRQHIEENLTPLAEELVSDQEPHLEQLAFVQHLRTDVRGRLKPGVRDADVLAALHPTPAVCGLPTVTALDVLRQHEGFDRGLYCGLVGTWRPDEAEFAVAIRSALVRGNEIELFAGAGIVEGSDPDAEWEETVEKLRTIGDVIGGSA